METEIYLRAQEIAETNRRLSLANVELERLYRKSQELDQIKSELLANVSHELRTPLALIFGPVEKLLCSSALGDSGRQDLMVVMRNARQLLRHVNDLLDVARLDAKKIELSYAQVDLAGVLRSVAQHFESLALEKNIRLDTQTGGPVYAQIDAEKIARVLSNLLSNALKFTPAGGRVRCSITTDHAAGMVLVEVADSGPGIPAAHRAMVFERFRQIDGGRQRRYGGIGLGLSIVREFVELHGGATEIGSAPEGGASLLVRLPILAPAGASLEPTAMEMELIEDPVAIDPIAPRAADRITTTDSPGSNAPLVLVVEDSEELNVLMREALAAEYRTEGAANGRDGLQKALALRPDIVVTDIMMPEMAGDELVSELRARAEFATTPIIVLSAKADDAFRLKLLRAGANDYLIKPLSLEELRTRVRNLMRAKIAGDNVLQLNEQLRKANAELETFSASVTHDLRSPLRAIIGLSGILLSDSGAVPAATRGCVQRIHAAGTRMSQLVDDLLQLARVDHVELKREPADFARISRAVHASLQAAEPDRRVELIVAADLIVHADPHLLEILCDNLLGNAWKFTSRVSPARIEIGVLRESSRTIYFMRDNGAGFDMGHTEHLFQPFKRLHAVTDFPGTGVGLATVRRIVERHGGRIWASAEPNRGATFCWTLACDVP